jgi:hypothetical protein
MTPMESRERRESALLTLGDGGGCRKAHNMEAVRAFFGDGAGLLRWCFNSNFFSYGGGMAQ